jgi:NAD+ synthase
MQQEKVALHIVNWLRDYAEASQMRGFVIGVSGGIDSAVTSALGARTGLPLICMEMPIHQDPDQDSRAAAHVRQLQESFPNVSGIRIDLTATFEAFKAAQPFLPADRVDLSLANTRSRLRMANLYHIATSYRYLVLGTGNKVEDFGVGFYTKYGDGGVDLSPIADLVKTEVYALGAYLGVSDTIMKAPPTDGLWNDGRTDEDQIGATYPELEWAMQQQSLGAKPEQFSGRQKEVMEIYLQHNRINQHKMIPIPVCTIPPTWKQSPIDF